MNEGSSKFRLWRDYYRQISHRIHFDRGFISSAIMVGRVFLHYGFPRLKPSASGGVASKKTSLAFYPNPAGAWYTIWMALQSTGIKITSSTEDADVVFIFDDRTENMSSEIQATLENIEGDKVYVNSNVLDISKTHVADVFQKIFGYPLSVDPLTYKGQAVCKSDENGMHDGHIIDLPIAPHEVKTDSVYQVLVDSTFNRAQSEDLRITYVFGEIPIVYHKFKKLNQRFGTTYLSTTVKRADDVFSSDELREIVGFCEAMGLNFGSADVMRDKGSGKIYIVDVNKTCMPVLSLPKADLLGAMETLGEVFERGVEARLASMS